MCSSASRKPRVLVIGWGFIGEALGQRLADEGVAVAGLTRSETPRTAAARVRGIRVTIGDATQPAVLADALAGVDHVLYGAGGLLPPSAAERPLDDLRGTLSPVISTLEALRRRPGVGLTYLSSGGTIYGNPVRIPVRETDPVRPISAYGVSRLSGELYAQMYAMTFGVPVQIVRCANVYGPGQKHDRTQGAVAVFLHRIAAGLPITILGDGSAVRDFVFIGDVSRALCRMITDQLDVGVVNIGSGHGHTVTEVVGLVSGVVGRPALIEYQPRRRHDVDAVVLDVSRLRSFLPYAPVKLHDGLRTTWSAQQEAIPTSLREPSAHVKTRPDALTERGRHT